ncbi:MAG TPA: hypothetical protein VFM93_02140 [Candidatus Limnocylindria bacterium]|nr:hypothetical protein [Candidatus Limnocylindria bacterium]
MQRLASTGLATAFFRLFILDAVADAPARPNALLIRVAAERLPFATGAFSRALQSLLEGGHLTPAPHGAVALTPVGAAERMAERERWLAVLPAVARIVGDIAARPAPVVAEPAPALRAAGVAEVYLDRVLVATIRERLGLFRDGGRPFAVVLGMVELEHASVAHRRAMLHRAIRATLGGARTLFGSDVDAFRYGDEGVALLAPGTGRANELTPLLRTRLDELLRTMTMTVRAYGGARWRVRAGGAASAEEHRTSTALLRSAQDALATDGVQPLA